MAEILRDQAEGLRRLLARSWLRSITVTGGAPGVGQTAAIINLAAAFARRGKNVLVLDEQGGGNAASQLGLRARWDLLHVIQRKKTLDEILVQCPPGIRIVPAAQALKTLGRLAPAEQDLLLDAFAGLSSAVDMTLVDARAGGMMNWAACLSLAAQESLVMITERPDSITDAYALIKLLSRNFARRRFHIVVNRVKSGQQAETIFANMAQAAGRFLPGVALQYLGCVPDDEKLARAGQLRQPVVELYPDAPSAIAFRRLAEAIEQWPYPGEDCLENFVQRLINGSRMMAESSNV